MSLRSKSQACLRLIVLTIAVSSAADAHEHDEVCQNMVNLPDTHIVSQHCSLLSPRRIVLVTSPNRQDRLKEQDLFVKYLANHLSRGPKLEIVVASEKICQDHLPMRTGTFDELHLLKLSRKYKADCVLFCDLNQLSAYHPMQAELSMLLVHVPESVALILAKSTYDLRDAETENGYMQFVRQALPDSALNVDHHTPTAFIDYTANQFASGILTVW